MNHVLRSFNGKFVVVYFIQIALNISKGISMDEVKIMAIKKWLALKNANEVRSFHGLASFYTRFVKNFSSIAAPFNVVFKWDDMHERAFNLLKDKLNNTHLLCKPNFDKALEIDVMLLLNRVKMNYSTYDKELYALVSFKKDMSSSWKS
ncbi:putative mitochondrial protein, partial [Mucuna pruriens]